MNTRSVSSLLIVCVATLAGCLGSESDTAMPDSTTVERAATVYMKDQKFAPSGLRVSVNTTVTWVNDEPVGHTITAIDPGLWGTDGSGIDPTEWLQGGDTWSFRFDKAGTYVYFCDPHAKVRDGVAVGMVGVVEVVADDIEPSGFEHEDGPGPAWPLDVQEIGRSADDLPPPIEREAPLLPILDPEPQHVTFELTSMEVTAEMADGTTYTYWTFDGQVPGPMLRARVGDTVTVRHHNDASSIMTHNIDLHAVTGPGGGAGALDAAPGETAELTFEALHPGVFVYHCAFQNPPLHIAHGMYGQIIIEPEGGLPQVDREFYVMQGEFYSAFDASEAGHHEFSMDAAMAEEPSFVVFNGRMGSLTADRALQAEVGETIRIFVGDGGPNLVSSFHVIGEIFDRVYREGDFRSEPAEGIQTTLIPAGGATAVELRLEVAGDFLLVDHSIFRVLKGAAGILHVTGESQPGAYEPGG